MTRFQRLLRSPACWAFAAATVAAVVVYGPSLHFDLFWDDYGSLRPRTWAALLAVWHGPWDPVPGGWPTFYRPLAIWYYAACFKVFGLNAWPLHVLSIVGQSIVGGLLGLFVAREADSRAAGAVAAAVYVAHPVLAYATGPWFSNQFHLLVSGCALGALLAWQRARRAPTPRGWWRVYAWIAVGFLVKEDTLMLAPALVLVQALRARLVRDVIGPSRALVAATAVFFLGAIGLRAYFLAGMGGYFPPPLKGVPVNLLRGPLRVLGILPDPNLPTVIAASVAAAGLIVGTLAAWRSPRSTSMRLWLTGAVVFVVADLPLALLSNLSRYHLLGLAAVLLIMAGAVAAGRAATARGVGRLAALSAAVVGIAVLGAANRAAQSDYRPCTAGNLARDDDIAHWAVVPFELQQWIQQKPAACASGRYRPLTASLDYVAWGLDPPDGDARGTTSGRATSDWIVLLVRRSALTLSLTVNQPDARATRPVRMTFSGDLAAARAIDLTAPDARDVTLTLRPSWWTWTRAMYRVDVRVTAEAPADRTVSVHALNVQ